MIVIVAVGLGLNVGMAKPHWRPSTARGRLEAFRPSVTVTMYPVIFKISLEHLQPIFSPMNFPRYLGLGFGRRRGGDTRKLPKDGYPCAGSTGLV